MVSYKKNKIEHFIVGPEKKADMKASVLQKWSIHNKLKDVFMGTVCFKGTFSLMVKDEAKPYLVSQRHVAYTINNHLKTSWTDCRNNKLLIT